MNPPGRSADGERTVVHLAPHPDDELIGAPATLMALRDAGWRVVNVACSLGRRPDKERREQELVEACKRAGFELRVVDVLRSGSEGQLVEAVGEVVEDLRPVVVVAPSPHDAHAGHEAVGRAAVMALERFDERHREGEPAERAGEWTGEEVEERAGEYAGERAGEYAGERAVGYASPRLWLWGLWADLAFPTLALAFGEDRMLEVLRCLEAHEGELARNDYRRLVHGRAEMNSSLGPERVFGFGSSASAPSDGEYVELLCEVALEEGIWRLGRPRWLDPTGPLGSNDLRDPLSGLEGGSPARQGHGAQLTLPALRSWPDGVSVAIGDWLHEPSTSSRYRRS